MGTGGINRRDAELLRHVRRLGFDYRGIAVDNQIGAFLGERGDGKKVGRANCCVAMHNGAAER